MVLGLDSISCVFEKTASHGCSVGARGWRYAPVCFGGLAVFGLGFLTAGLKPCPSVYFVPFLMLRWIALCAMLRLAS